MPKKPKRLRSHDPITTLSEDGKLVRLVVEKVVRGRIDTLYATGRFQDVRRLARFPLRVADEDDVWVRGHVTERDEAGAAMLAARAMQG